MIAANRRFASGADGFVRLSNETGETNRVVIADAVQFAYRAEQDTPARSQIPLWWQNAYFGTNIDAMLDHDADGYPTWTEYVLGTAPNDPGSALRMEFSQTGSQSQIAFAPAHSDRNYQLQTRSSVEGEDWLTLTNVAANPDGLGRMIFTVTNSVDPNAFYRLKVNW